MNELSILIMSSVRWFNASADYALNTAIALNKAGFNVHFFGIPDSPVVKKAKENGLNLIDSIDITEKNPFKYITSLLKFRLTIKKIRPDVINTHFSKDHTFLFLSSLFVKKRIIRTRSDSIPPRKNFLNRLFYKYSASHFIVPAAYLATRIKDLGIIRNRITVIQPELNYRDFAEFKSAKNLKADLMIPENKQIVSYVGRLDRIKGVDIFIRSLRYIKNAGKFYFIISGEEVSLTVNDLKKIAAESGITNISFIDRIDDVRDILNITDIGVIPSIGSEAICRIGMEMLSFGIPVIGSDINAVRELIYSAGGIAIKPGVPEEIASAIDFLYNKKNYKNLRKKIMTNVRNRLPDRFSAELTELFLKISEK